MKTLEQKLKAKFKQENLETRILQSGVTKDGKVWAKLAFYLDARAVQDRLDEACGMGGWKQLVNPLDKGVLCTLSIKFGDEWVGKQDGAEYTDVEGFKGGISDALKRAAVHFGIGRYLYEIKDTFAEVVMTRPANTKEYNYVKESKNKFGDVVPQFWWKAPKLPAQYLPEVESKTIKFEGINQEQLRQSLITELTTLCKQVLDPKDFSEIDFISMEIEEAQVQLKNVKDFIKEQKTKVKAV